MYMSRLGGAVALALATLVSPAQAVPFGPASASMSFLFTPAVTLTPPTGMAAFNGGLFLLSPTGSLSGRTTGTGNIAGTLAFSTAVGATTANVINDFFVLNDTSGGTFNFNALTATTQTFSDQPGVSTSIALYVLGTLGDANLNLDATPTSLTITLNQTGSAAYSGSATLSNPPSPIEIPVSLPDPASLALLGSGLAAVGLLRRRK